jgi:excisionase family DNA binding protein
MTPDELDRLADMVADRVAIRLERALPPADDGLLDAQAAARLLGCSVPTVERMTRRGDLPSCKVGRLRRYRRSDLESLAGGADDR